MSNTADKKRKKSIIEFDPFDAIEQAGQTQPAAVGKKASPVSAEPAPTIENEPPAKKVEAPMQVPTRRRGRPKSDDNLRKGYRRYTFPVEEDLLEHIQDWAWFERVNIYDVINTALKEYMKDKPHIDRNNI